MLVGDSSVEDKMLDWSNFNSDLAGSDDDLVTDEDECEDRDVIEGDDWKEIEEDALDSNEETDLVALICLLMILPTFSPSRLNVNQIKSEWLMLR